MKKVFVIAASLLMVAGMAQAASDQGTLNESIAVGKIMSVGLNVSPTGWTIVSNTKPAVATATINSGNLLINGKSAGVSSISVCTTSAGTHCLAVNVIVTGSVLGETVTAAHPAGSWVLSQGTIYYIANNGIIPITSWSIFLSNGGKQSLIQPASSADLNLPLLGLMTAKDSRVK